MARGSEPQLAPQLLKEVVQVNFTLRNTPINFNEKGDPPNGFEVVQWRWDDPDQPFRGVATYDAPSRQLRVHEQNIVWHTPDDTVGRMWGRGARDVLRAEEGTAPPRGGSPGNLQCSLAIASAWTCNGIDEGTGSGEACPLVVARSAAGAPSVRPQDRACPLFLSRFPDLHFSSSGATVHLHRTMSARGDEEIHCWDLLLF